MSINSRKKKFHFVGIGGAGMSGLAEIILELGHFVAGSDRQKSDVTEYLENQGALIFEGHERSNIKDVDFLIRSSAINKNNPEIQMALELGIPIIRRAEMLGQLFNRKFGIGVAGTHGKTTTTSMLSDVLIGAELDPTIIVGGKIKSLMTNARLGNGEILVAEADEYDRSFLTLFPRIAVITSLEADHLDIYEDLADLKNTFVRYANQVAFDGAVVVCIDDPNIREILGSVNNTVISYGLSDQADYQAKNIRFDLNKSEFEVLANGQFLGKITLNVPGSHNIKNALSVVTVGMELEVPFDKISNALSHFAGVERRFEIIGTEQDIMVVDDYAHHPTEVAATLESAKKGWQRRIIAVFQPHLYSRTKDFQVDFANALTIADVAVVTDIYPAREEPLPGVTGFLIAEKIDTESHYVANKDELTAALIKITKPGDMVLFLGAGDINQFSKKFLKQIKGN